MEAVLVTNAEKMPRYFSKKEADAKLKQVIITNTQFGIIPPLTYGTVSEKVQVGSDFLLKIHWNCANVVQTLTDVVGKNEYETFVELPHNLLPNEETLEIIFLALDLRALFSREEIQQFQGKSVETISPHLLEKLLPLLPEIPLTNSILQRALCIALDPELPTEDHLAITQAFQFQKTLSPDQINLAYDECKEIVERAKNENVTIKSKARITLKAFETLTRTDLNN
jgi:hypothetical protein